jgi:hypothetical protein
MGWRSTGYPPGAAPDLAPQVRGLRPRSLWPRAVCGAGDELSLHALRSMRFDEETFDFLIERANTEPESEIAKLMFRLGLWNPADSGASGSGINPPDPELRAARLGQAGRATVQPMQDIEIAITEQGMKDALAALAKADKSAIYAKQLKAKIFDGEQRGPGINALRSLIAYARAHPGGRVERIMTKRRFFEGVGISHWSEDDKSKGTLILPPAK